MALPLCFQQEFVDACKLPLPAPAPPTHITKTCADVIHFMKEGKIKKAKNIVRTQHWPIDHPGRGQLWLKLCQGHTKEAVPLDYYQSTVKESLGGLWPPSLPAFADPMFCEDYLLTEEGHRRAERVLYIVSISHPFVTYCPILHPVTCLLLHYLSEEQTYECVCALVDGTVVRHASQTRLMNDTSTHTLMRLTKHLAKPTYDRLVRHVLREDEVERIFRTWQLWIFRGLPFYHLVRTMDCFLIEGVRALYRIAMAILILYVKDHSSEYPTKSLFSRWFSIKKGRNKVSNFYSAVDTPREGGHDLGGFPDRIIAFCKEMPYNVDKLFKTAYSIQGVSGKLLNQQLLKSEAYIRSRSSVRRRASSESALSVTGRRTEVTAPRLAVKTCGRGPTRAVSVGIIPLANFRSEVLTAEQMSIVWNWLPPRITTLRPEVIYSTNKHGTSLTNLFLRTDTREPTMLAILTTRGDRFGAYCSTRWQERRRAPYFGTGETFLFTFAPEPRRFEWVGVNSALDVPHSSKLFLSANQHMIQIGAGNGMGLYIDGSLENGRTEHCDTFDNAPLASTKDFVIRILEVVAFA